MTGRLRRLVRVLAASCAMTVVAVTAAAAPAHAELGPPIPWTSS
ncbi:hypothetical protein [Phytohabitans suffuscus]|nr:hypothetical protein [Phytohabitans suffuscus]